MRTIRMTLLALVFGLSACSFSLTSGPAPYTAYPQTLAALHGRGKPARRVVREPVATLAKTDEPARPAALDPQPEPPRPMLVGPVKPPKPMRVGHVKPPKPMRVGHVKPPKVMRVGPVKPSKPMRVGPVDPPKVMLVGHVDPPKSTDITP